MRRTLVVLAAVAAMALGGLAYVLATTIGGSAQPATAAASPSTTMPLPRPPGAAKGARPARGIYGLARRVVHAELVVRARGGTFKTLDIDRGTISAVSSRSLTVTRPDGAKVTEATDSTTRFGGRPEGQLQVGGKVLVISSGGKAIAVRSPGARARGAGPKGSTANPPSTTAPPTTAPSTTAPSTTAPPATAPPTTAPPTTS